MSFESSHSFSHDFSLGNVILGKFLSLLLINDAVWVLWFGIIALKLRWLFSLLEYYCFHTIFWGVRSLVLHHSLIVRKIAILLQTMCLVLYHCFPSALSLHSLNCTSRHRLCQIQSLFSLFNCGRTFYGIINYL